MVELRRLCLYGGGSHGVLVRKDTGDMPAPEIQDDDYRTAFGPEYDRAPGPALILNNSAAQIRAVRA
jgi:hypothetical protein